MVRNPATIQATWKARPDLQVVAGDFSDYASMVNAFSGCDTLLNIGSLGFGYGPDIVRAAEKAGVRRAVFISTTAIFTQLNAQTKAVRLAAEEAIRNSGLEWTIIRPTMIYGSERDRNIFRLLKLLSWSPVFPMLGDGEHLQQPIFVEDLARAIVDALESECTVNKAYNVAGKEPLTFNELVRQAAAALGRKVWLVHVPQALVLPALGMYNRLSRRPLLKVEQVLRLNEDKAFSYQEAARDFGFSARSFQEGVQEMVACLRRTRLL